MFVVTSGQSNASNYYTEDIKSAVEVWETRRRRGEPRVLLLTIAEDHNPESVSVLKEVDAH